MKTIKLTKGFAEVPDNAPIVDLSGGNAVDVGVIIDTDGELPTLVVVSDKSVSSLSPSEGDDLINAAIQDLPSYQEVKAKELPYPAVSWKDIKFKNWNKTVRLHFFPLSMFKTVPVDGYRIYE